MRASLSLLLALSAAVSCASQAVSSAGGSTIAITSPRSGDTWYSNSTNLLTWTGSEPGLFSVQILNSNNLILANGLSVFNNVPSAAQALGVSIGQLAHADGYTVRIYNVNNISDTYAVSPTFKIHNVTASAGPSSSVKPGYVLSASSGAATAAASGSRSASATGSAGTATASNFGTFGSSGSGGKNAAGVSSASALLVLGSAAAAAVVGTLL